MFSNTSAGFLCKGPRYATPEDFEGREFGTFQHSVDGWATDPVEVRIMAGQPAGSSDEQGLNNEDVGVASMTIEVFGCKLEEEPVCGNGQVEYPEECDLGPENGFGRACSMACTKTTTPRARSQATAIHTASSRANRPGVPWIRGGWRKDAARLDKDCQRGLSRAVLGDHEQLIHG
jgi:hypothetical protein|eukprot:37491-Prymnesium_polylepis.2